MKFYKQGDTGVMSMAERIIREKELLTLLGISKSTRWRWEREGILPPRRRLGKRLIGWLASEIEEFLESREQAI